MNPGSPSAPAVPFDLALVSEAGGRPTNALDLDTMAAIAEEAGRDAASRRDVNAHTAFSAIPLTDDMLVAAARLYRACHRGATDPATD